MKRIDKLLKKEAESVLPSGELKERVRSRVLSELGTAAETAEAREPALAAASAAGGTRSSVSPARRRTAIVVVAVLAAVMVALSFYFAFATVAIIPSPVTYVSLAVNPAFGISVAGDDTVTEVTPLNEDAAVVLYGMDLTGRPAGEAVQLIMLECAALGLIDTTETRTVELLTVNDSAARESELSRSLTNSLLGLFSSAGWKTGVHAANAEEAEDGTRYAYRATDYCSPGKSILVDAVRRLTGRSERALASEGASDLDKLLNSYDENRMAAVAERLEKGYSDSGSKAEADKLAAEKSSLDKFAEGLRSALTLLDDLDEDDFGLDLVSRLIELVGNDYIDLGSAIRTLYEDVVAGALLGGDIIEEFMDSLEDLFEDMIDLYEEDVREFALTVARETNEWKSEMLDELASFFD